MARKREKNEDNIDLSKLPPHLQNMDAGYSALEHMCDTPMTNAVLRSLRKKSADISFLCGTMCDAAVQEGSKRFMTKTLATITREARFHSRLATASDQYMFPLLEICSRTKQGHYHDPLGAL